MDDDLLTFVVFSKTNAFRRQFTADGTADLNLNGISTAEFTLDDADELLQFVTGDSGRGARCAVWFRGAERMRGAITSTPGSGPIGDVTVRIDSDMRKMWQWQGWPVPTADLAHQTTDYRTITGPSETIFKTALAENVARLGVPWTVVPTHGWGTSTVVALRFHPLGDKVIPPLLSDQLVIVLTYDDDGHPVVDVRQPRTVPGTLTIDSGVPDRFSFDVVAPTATRVIVGGRGEGADRQFLEVADAAREADWGEIIEAFADARNVEVGADLTPYAADALTAGAASVSVTTELVETDGFLFGSTFDLGDLVRVSLGPVNSTEQIQQVAITSNASDGTKVTPKIGGIDPGDVDAQLTAQINRLAQGARDQSRR